MAGKRRRCHRQEREILALITPRVCVVDPRQNAVINALAGNAGEEIAYATEISPPDIERKYSALYALFKNAL